MKSFLGILVGKPSFGHKVKVVDRQGEIVSELYHEPYFVSDRLKPCNICKYEKKKGFFLKFDESLFSYVPEGSYVYLIKVPSKNQVPLIAKEFKAKNARVGMYNITYDVRVAYDIQRDKYGILGYPTPLAFLPNDDMLQVMEKVIDDSSKLKILALDIEVLSTRGGFPAKGDPILSITYGTIRLGEERIFTRDGVSDIHTIINETQDRDGSREVVKKVMEAIYREKPDVIVTYNGTGFDFPYMEMFLPRNMSLQREFVIINDRAFIHVDLDVVRRSLGSSLGLRSQVATSLDDVAVDVIKTLKKFYNVGWLLESEYLEAEKKLDHAKLGLYFRERNKLVYDYIVADVLLTLILGRVWIYPLILLSTMTGIPLNTIQKMNTGQMGEYLMVEFLNRLGFYPELRTREYTYSRITSIKRTKLITGEESVYDKLSSIISNFDIFTKGKVYTKDYGLFLEDDKKVIELDFEQLYPTDMVSNTSDPTSIYIKKVVTVSGDDIEVNNVPLKIPEKKTNSGTWVLLKQKDTMKFINTVPGYGPISWLIYKMFVARQETKKLKKRAKEEKRIELLAPDQAIKTFNNSTYGSFGKRRGNLMNELVASSVFWRTQSLLYNVIDMVENDVSKEVGEKLTVLYGDSVHPSSRLFILEDDNIRRMTISDLFKQVDYRIGGKEYYVPDKPIYTLAFKDGKVVWGRVKYVVRHFKVGKLYRVCFSNKECVLVTPDHSLIIHQNKLSLRTGVYGDKEYAEVSVRDILPNFKKGRTGGSLVVLSRIPVNYTENRVRAEENSPNNCVLYTILGLIKGSKHVVIGKNSIRISIPQPNMKSDIIKELKSSRLVMTRLNSNKITVIFKNRLMMKWILDNQGIPDFNTGKEIRCFLKGFLASSLQTGNGKGVLRIRKKNYELLRDISDLLRLFGIMSSIIAEGSNSTLMYTLYISDAGSLENLLKDKGGDTRDVWFKGIKYIDEVDYVGYVYDVEVEDCHNFFANNILVHNTDSTYIYTKTTVDGERVEMLVNKKIAEITNPLYQMKLEGEYKGMFIPKQKDTYTPSAKTYLAIGWDGEIVKIKGEFFKMPFPLAIKERVLDFFRDLILLKPKNSRDIEKLVFEYLKGDPYKFFIKKSVSSFVSESDPSKFKNLNKPFHYGALVFICLNKTPGTNITNTRNINRMGLIKQTWYKCVIDPRIVEDTQSSIIIHYLPSTTGDSRKFTLYVETDGNEVRMNEVSIDNYKVVKGGTDSRSEYDRYISIEFTVTPMTISKEELKDYVIRRIRREVIDILNKKFVKAIKRCEKV